MIMSKIKIPLIATLLTILLALTACGGYEKVDQRTRPDGAQAKARKNIEEGRGASIGGLTRGIGRGTTYEFSSSNPMWRASLETLDFLPLTTVDYSGGIIITDWYSNEMNSDESIKISIRFLTNEIRSDALKVSIFKRNCKNNMNCKVTESKDTLSTELIKQILKKATIYKKENEDKEKQKKKI